MSSQGATRGLLLALALGQFACGRLGYDSLLLQSNDDPAAGGAAGTAGGGGETSMPPSPNDCPNGCSNAHGTARCESGSCSITCELGYADCDADPRNGCEADTASTRATCGSCGVSCTNGHGTSQCRAGLCAPTCDPGFSDCDLNPTNGCERALDSVTDCGGCGLACGDTNAVSACVAGACSPTCSGGFGDCDGNPNNGCETDLNNDPAHCGTCPNTCAGAGQICVAGSCQASLCPPGLGDCDTDPALSCGTNIDSSLQNCGFCNNACSTPNGTPLCSAGECRVQACEAGFDDCDRTAQNGCETALTTTTAHCGACGAACTNEHGNTSCSGSTCIPTCSTGFDDCDSSRQNGCETSLDSIENCGACGNVCPGNGGTPVCSAGVCGTLCDLNGTFALEIDMNGSWPTTANVRSGGGVFHFWLKADMIHAGNSLAATVTECGRFMPEIVNRVNESLIHGYDNRVFDGNFLPSSSAAITLTASSPGATLTWPLTANELGISLANPKTDSWPRAASDIPAARRVDMDRDGKPGVTGTYATGDTFTRTSAAIFGFNRADIPYYAARVAFSLNGTLGSCSASSGVASMSHVDLRIYGCNLEKSTKDCSASEGAFVDANTPTVVTGAATYVLKRVAPGSDCPTIRAALP